MVPYHFVEDYERLVAEYLTKYPLDEAMARLVGGNLETFAAIGRVECQLLQYAGLKPRMTLVDLGCGSGRLSCALGQTLPIEYTGLDIIPAFLDFAKTISPPHYKFILNRSLTLPVPDESSDFISAFSVFTHLLHGESFSYMQEARRILKRGGRLVFSFLEFSEPTHWHAFEAEYLGRQTGGVSHLNCMIERSVIPLWAEKLGFKLIEIIDCNSAPWGGAALGQTTAILESST